MPEIYNNEMIMKKLFFIAAALFAGIMSGVAQDNIATATYGNATGNTTRTMTIALNGTPANYIAFQAELALPDGTIVTDVKAKAPLINNGKVSQGTLAGESTDFKIPFSMSQDKKTCKILGYNYGNVAMSGTSGDILLTVTLSSTSPVAYNQGTVATKNVVFVKSDLTEINMAGAAQTTSKLWGDANGDKEYTPADILGVIDCMLNKDTNGIDKFAADNNLDGEYTPADILGIIDRMLNKQ